MKKVIILALFCAGLGARPARGVQLVWTWDGGGTDNLWTDTGNWTLIIGGAPQSGATTMLQFGGNTRLAPNNNNVSFEASEIVFMAGSGAYTLTGNPMSLGGLGEIANNSSSTQTVSMAVTLAANSIFSAASGPLAVSSIDGAHNLTLMGSFPVTLAGAVGATTPPSNLTANGPVTASNGTITTSGNQIFNGSLTVAAPLTVTASSGTLTFGSSIEGANPLTFTGSAVNLEGPVGDVIQPSNITVNGPVTASCGSIFTSGNQIYNGSLTVAAPLTVTASSGTLTFGSSIEGANPLTFTGSAVNLEGPVGDVIQPSNITVNGPVTASCGSIFTSGNQIYNGSLTVAAPLTVTASSGALTFGSSIEGANPLTFTGTAVNLEGPVGDVIQPSNITVNGPVTASCGSIFTSGNQIYNGSLTVAAPLTVTASSGALTFDSSIEGANPLTFTGSAVNLEGPVGDVIQPSNITVNGPATVTSTSIITIGSQIYNGTVTLASPVSMTSSSAGNLNLVNGVSGNGNSLALSTAGTLTVGGTLTGVDTLSVTGGTMDVSPGATVAVGSATISATASVSGEIVAEGGTLTFNGPVTINNIGVIDALNGNVVFNSSVINNGTILTRNCLPIMTVVQVVQPDVEISFTTCSNINYIVKYATDLAGGAWTTLTNLTATGSVTTVADRGAAGLPKRFYRAALVGP